MKDEKILSYDFQLNAHQHVVTPANGHSLAEIAFLTPGPESIYTFVGCVMMNFSQMHTRRNNMGDSVRRHLGRILLDGKFLSQHDLDSALKEQSRTKALLGETLVRMGILREEDVKVPLLVQKHLSTFSGAVSIAAGERQLLGELLVRSGRITSEQLDRAISEQKRTGEKLGDVFKRLGMLSEGQLNALLNFQVNQEAASDSPLRLGELLVATGQITREQLEYALSRQSLSKSRLGEVLLQEG
ncbi:MAG TPA: hypothetical protein PLI53_08745, partial [Geobacteraceae bacterium]|nr:hypothetical protein [Geobacteraceae bacterium]